MANKEVTVEDEMTFAKKKHNCSFARKRRCAAYCGRIHHTGRRDNLCRRQG